MIRIITDFQAVDSQGSFFIFRVDHEDLEQQISRLCNKKGDKVILGAHEDFELIGTLDFRFVDALGKEAWVANPDWSTRKDKTV